jgi:hypothetical protein
LLYRYAECLDAGDFDGVADLFAHATLTAEGRSMHRVGRDEVLAMYTDNTRRYPETGTPRTKHVTTNPIVTVDEAAGTARCRSYCTVLQAVPGLLALQPIWAGRYHDEFERVDGTWRFVRRHFIADLEGDLSQHLIPGVDRS